MIDPIVKKCGGYEHLHLHSTYSTLDGFGSCEEYTSRWRQYGKYFCVSDHGSCAVIPDQIKMSEQHNLLPIFASELYLNNGHPSKDLFEKMSPEEKKAIKKSYHLLAIAYNNVGYHNLIRLSSDAWENFYYKPRITYDLLMKYKEGIIFTSCCYNSEIGQAFDKKGEDAAFEMVEKYMTMFGEHFYLEIMLLDFKKQKPYNIFILKAHDKYHIPLILTCDTHYCEKTDSKFQQYMLMIQNDVTIKDIEKKLSQEDKEDIFELQDTNLWMKTEEELNEKWLESYSDVIPYDLFSQAKLNTVKICEKAKGIQIDRTPKLPQLPDAEERLKEAIIIGAKWRGVTNDRRYINRLKEEYELICRKGFASYFLINKMLVAEARRISPILLGFGDGSEALNSGRGSGVSSLTCYCLGITGVDPMNFDGTGKNAELIFSRFMSESRGGKSLRLKFKN